MSTLLLALYCEGSTDHRFLPPVISQTARRILDNHQRNNTDVASIRLVEVKKKKRPESILQAAREALGFHALIVHTDADYPSPDKAWYERFEPGYKLVQQTKEDVGRDLLPIIPVQAIEAWMLADYELLLEEIGTKLNAYDLDIPVKANQVEAISKPKLRLKKAIRTAYAGRSKRHREIDIDFLYQPIGERIKLERLMEVPSYVQFVEDLTDTLRTLNVIPTILKQ